MPFGPEKSVPLSLQWPIKQGGPSEPVDGSGMLKFIMEMESPLHGHKFALSGVSEDKEEENDAPQSH